MKQLIRSSLWGIALGLALGCAVAQAALDAQEVHQERARLATAL